MSTLSAINLKHPSSASNNIVLDSSGNMTGAGTLAMSSSFLRNRIINGAMVIDQRNNGAATANTINGYTVDRWIVGQTVTGKLIAQRNAGSVTPPAGFSNYLGVTSQSAYAVLSSDIYRIYQLIEGFNVSDLAWGTASAQTVTVSFWVRSSLTGTFGGAIGAANGSRTYPFSYTISAANTWEQKSVTIPGDTSGTYPSDNTASIALQFGLGVGSTFSGTAGAWSGSALVAPTGAVSVVGTNGATFYLTGVQLEVGSVATPFERRLYGQELALCQRYYLVDSVELRTTIRSSNSTERVAAWFFPVAMRTAPTITATATGGTGGSSFISTLKADLTITFANSTDSGGLTNRVASAEL